VVLNVAKYLEMMNSGFVWIATNWLSTILDTDSPLASNVMDDIQGVITLRMYTPDSKLKRKFISRWSNLTGGRNANGSFGLNSYGLYAYDTVWLLAHAIDLFFNHGGDISFSNYIRSTELQGGSLNLDALNIFNGGNLLLKSILQVNMTGVTGPIEFTSDRNFINPAFEVINVIGTGFRRVGYWTNYSGLSVLSPEVLYTKPPNRSSANQRVYSVIWPGQTIQQPRGWAFPKNGRQLRIGVPNRISYREFVSQV
jgi:ionotropic glutamate receptor